MPAEDGRTDDGHSRPRRRRRRSTSKSRHVVVMVMAFFLLHLFYRYIMHSRSETPRADAIPGRETINILPPKEMGAEIMSARLFLPPSDWKLDRNRAADARRCERLLVIQKTLSISLGKDLPFEIWSPRPANCFHRRQAAKLRNTDTFVEHSTADIFAPKKSGQLRATLSHSLTWQGDLHSSRIARTFGRSRR